MKQPEKLTDEELLKIYKQHITEDGFEYERAIETAVNQRWLDMIAAQEPVATVAEVHMSRYTIEWANGPLPEGTQLYVYTPTAKQNPVAWEQFAIKFANGKKLTYEKPEGLPSYIGVRPLYALPPAQPSQEPAHTAVADILVEAASVLQKVREHHDDAWERFGLRDFLSDELTGTALIVRDTTPQPQPDHTAQGDNK